MDNEVDVMHVVRVPPMGKLVVKVGNGRYQHISQVRDEAVRQLLMAAIGELIVFADGYGALEAEGVAPPLSVNIDTSQPPIDPSLEERRIAFLASLERERDVMYVTDAEFSGSVHPVGARESDRTGGTGPLSIIGQINPILQKHVAADEKVRDKKIELNQDPKGGLLIEVDGKYYKRPDEIDDPDVRRIIRAALKEWDRS